MIIAVSGKSLLVEVAMSDPVLLQWRGYFRRTMACGTDPLF